MSPQLDKSLADSDRFSTAQFLTSKPKRYRWLVTPICRHIFNTGQLLHFGKRPVQICLPKGTSRLFNSIL
jgi:hypothetical protein